MKIRISSSRDKPRSAFTLIEIMVATVVMVILTGIVIQITSEVLKVWNRSSGKLAANAEARIAMDLITQDLEAAVFRNNDVQWLRSEKSTTDISTNTEALRLFSSALDRPEGNGDICAIAYQLEQRDPVTGSPSIEGSSDDRLWILYRLVVDPEDTFEYLLGQPAQNILPSSDDSHWNTDNWSGYPIVGEKGSNYLVGNIVNFEIDFYVEDDGYLDTTTKVQASANGLSENTRFGCGYSASLTDIKTGATVGRQAYNWLGSPNRQQLAYRKPLSYATIRLTILSDQGAQMLQNIDRIPETIDDVIREYGEVYTRRVNFLARPL